MSSALVTGASSGIGLEIAKILSKDVDRLVITGRRKDLLDELADALSEYTCLLYTSPSPRDRG